MTKGSITSCYTSLALADAAALAATSGTANCGGTVALSVSDNAQTCPATITVTAKDNCGNSATVTYSARILTAPPSFQNLPPITASYQCYSQVPSAPVVTATDSCGATLTVTFAPKESNPGSSCNDTITRTWTATDCASQTATYTQTITVQSTTAPSMTKGSIASCYTSLTLADAAALAATSGTANCSGTVALSVSDNGQTCPATITVTGADSCGLTSTVTYSANILITPPVLSGCPTNTNMTVQCAGLIPTVPTVTAVDACGTTLSVSYNQAETSSTSTCSNVITRTWSATDCAGQTTNYTQVITQLNNVTPALTQGSIASCYTTLALADAAALAATQGQGGCSSGLTWAVKNSSQSCAVNITVTGTDGCGNSASAIYSTKILTAPPSLQNLPPITASYQCYSQVPSAPVVTATDSCGATLAVTFAPKESNPGSSCNDTITRTWTATDCAGQTATYTQTITVQSTTAPTMTKGSITSCYTSLALADAAALKATSGTANCGGTVALSVSDNAQTCPATITVTGKDNCGNSATVTYSARILTAPPTLHSLPAASTNYACYSQVPAAAAVTATDSCGGTVTVVLTSNESNPGSSCNDTITRTWTATDCAGQTTSFTQAITVKSTVPPTISHVPTGGYLGCNSASAPSDANVQSEVTALAQCGSATITVTHVDATNGCTGSRTFTITAKDGCGNTSTASLVYTWTAGSTGLIVTCPTNVTIVTNICEFYCTFPPNDWCASSNNNWWQNWCSSNSGSHCGASWSNWWSSCGGNTQLSNWWSNWNSSQPKSCWGSWAGYQNGHWWDNWNSGNQGCCWVPAGGNNPCTLLANNFNNVYPNGSVCIGEPNGGYCLTFTSAGAVCNGLGISGNPGTLNGNSSNPKSCSAGFFCSQVLALKLNCDFGDYGGVPGFVGKCGDLVLMDSTSPCNGKKVRDILNICNCALGDGSCPAGCTPQYLCGLCSDLNQCFEGCQVSGWCSNHLCHVYIPPVSLTGTATVTDACSPTTSLTNCDTVTTGQCAGTYVIDREWIAVDACGNSNTCTQVITVSQTNSAAVSGVVVLACSGDSNLSDNEGLANVTVSLKNSGGSVVASTTTGDSGNYSFAGVAAGNYTVVVTPPSGYTETIPASSGNSISVAVAPCQNVTGANFAYIGSTAGVRLIKTGPCKVAAGGTITYSFAVTNTGNACETVQVSDPLLGGTIFSQSSVAPGQGFVFTSNYVTAAKAYMLTNTATAIGTGPNGNTATSTSTVTTCVTTKCVTNSICSGFNSQNPGNGWVWCNAHLNCNPGKPCTVYCQNASITLNCNDGKSYTFPVPDCQVNFTPNCSSGSCSFDGTTWQTTLPCAGDNQILLSGCGIPWQSDFANCHSVCWTGAFSCSTPGINCNWQWSAACYNTSLGNCGQVNVKPCLNTQCGYNNGDQAGTPENYKNYCQGGACGGGGANYTGSWSGTGSFTCN
jgi:uncharacterized repeat protein (TIGR01451 family)